MIKKRCPKCGKIKNVICFCKNKNTKDGLQGYCKKCGNKCRRKAFYKKHYGISIETYNELKKKQGYKCAICGKRQKDMKKRLCVDHSHKTNFVRGLLCNYCNSKLLRYLHDNKNRAIGLVKYLLKALKDDVNWK